MTVNENVFSKSYGDGSFFKAGVADLLSAPVDVIVNPANSGLSHGGGLAAIISKEAGPDLNDECDRIVKKLGKVPVTLGVPTSAYNLPYKGIIHSVGPRMGEGDEQDKLERTIINALQIAEKKEWQSVAFPAISTGAFGVPKQICAEAFKRALPTYWENNAETNVSFVFLCLMKDDFEDFYDILGR